MHAPLNFDPDRPAKSRRGTRNRFDPKYSPLGYDDRASQRAAYASSLMERGVNPETAIGRAWGDR